MKNVFTLSVTKSIKVTLNKSILNSETAFSNMKKEMKRIFQMANRRIQNLEKSGIYSPALDALNVKDIQKYSKFNVSGKSWVELRIEYAKAVKFLQSPTSTATGARQYMENIRKQYDLTKNELKIINDKLKNVSLTEQQNNFINAVMKYSDAIENVENEVNSLASQLESEAKKLENAVELLNPLDKDIKNLFAKSKTLGDIGATIDFLEDFKF